MIATEEVNWQSTSTADDISDHQFTYPMMPMEIL